MAWTQICSTLATALYVMVDDLLIAHPEWLPERLRVGIAPKLSDADLITLAVLQVLLDYKSERHFIRDAKTQLRRLFCVHTEPFGLQQAPTPRCGDDAAHPSRL